jgi:glycosyltransferase involved in cell wall biosynthesis
VLTRLEGALKKALGSGQQGGPRPLVSVVLGTYNRLPFLQQAIGTVRDNGIKGDYETIVVDGGSNDGTLQWLVEQKDVITIVQHNRGEFRGRRVRRRSWGYFMNLGFKTAQGRYVLMISDDCLLLPGAVNTAADHFERLVAEGRRVGAVAFYYRNWPNETKYYVQRTLGRKLLVNHGLFARDVLEQVGWADEERYLFYKADGDLCLKIWNAGYEIVGCPGAFVEHYEGANPDVRKANRSVLQRDRDAYVNRWKGVYEIGARDVQDREYLEFDDPNRTAEQFLDAAEAAATPQR